MNTGYQISFDKIFAVLFVFTVFACENKDQIKKEYMVQIKEEFVESIKLKSERFGLKFKNKVVSNIYLFETEKASHSLGMLKKFSENFPGQILAIEPREYSKLRYLSDSPAPMGFKQWILTRRLDVKSSKTWPYYGMNIQEAWSMGCTGEGIVIAVVDTGIELTHADLRNNINPKMSRSFIEGDTGDANPARLPFYQEFDNYLSHGTLAAGLIASEFGNGICSAGVAFNATLVSLKVFMLDEMTQIWLPEIRFPEDYISQALEYNRDKIDVYSCSFTLDSIFSNSTNHIRTVLREGVEQGRKGKGNIYVFSAGNNEGAVYDCNMVSYTNSIYTIAISSVGKGGTRPWYSVPCSCILAATYGEYTTYNGSDKLESTTLDGKCDCFIGTSASAALASGIIAQILQANSELTWRDVQYIIVLSSSLDRITYSRKSVTNGVGFKYNPYFGFGIMNAAAAVLEALHWTNVPVQINHTIFETVAKRRLSKIDASAVTLKFPYCDMNKDCLRFIEHVRVNMEYNIQAEMETQLEIILCSPSKTCSVLLHKKLKRKYEKTDMYITKRHWNFTSVQFWGEHPFGDWTLVMKVHKLPHTNSKYKTDFHFGSAKITFFGTATYPFRKTFVLNDISKKKNVIEGYIKERDQILKRILLYMCYIPTGLLYFVILISSLMLLVV